MSKINQVVTVKFTFTTQIEVENVANAQEATASIVAGLRSDKLNIHELKAIGAIQYEFINVEPKKVEE